MIFHRKTGAGEGIRTLDPNLGKVSPGVIIGAVTAAPQIYIRGVGDFAATGINNPAVALNVDGIYLARPDSIAADMYDLQRVEVLKGPQGTLYGRNASGGAVNLITAAPRLGELSGRASVEIGNYDAFVGEAALNIPIGDTIAIRVAGNYVSRDGFTTEGFGDADQYAMRARALWEPSDAVSLLLNFSTGHVGGSGPASVVPTSVGKFVDGVAPSGQAYIASHIPAGGFGIGPALRDNITLPGPNDRGYDNNYTNVSAQLDADLGFATLTVIPAYRRTTNRYVSAPWLKVEFGGSFLAQADLNAPPSPANQTTISGPETSDAISLEVRLSNESDRLKWVLGGYFFEEDQYTVYEPTFPPMQDIGYVADLKSRAYAAFAQASFSLTDTFRVIGGIRVTSDRREIDGSVHGQPSSGIGYGPPPAFTPQFGPPFAFLIETYAGKKTFNNVSWKAGIEFDLAPDSLAYATVSTGFKAGGFSQLASMAVPGAATSFEPEKLTSYDIGLKNRFLDNRLQLNLGAFYWDYRNQQVNRFAPNSVGGIGIEFVNAQKATIYGANVDFVARPWRGATFTVGAEYTHSEYDEFILESFNYLPGSTGCSASPSGNFGSAGPAYFVDCSGMPTSRTPKWSGNVGFTQSIDVGSNELQLSVDSTFASSRWLNFDYIPAELAPSYALVNASAEFNFLDGQVSAMLFVRNIGNKQVFMAGAEPAFAPGAFVGQVLPPRTYGLRVSVKF